MTPNPEIEVLLVIRQAKGGMGQAVRRGTVDLLLDPEATMAMLRDALEEALQRADLPALRSPR